MSQNPTAVAPRSAAPTDRHDGGTNGTSNGASNGSAGDHRADGRPADARGAGPLDLSAAVNAEYLDGQYGRYLADPQSVGGDWRAFFAGFDLGAGGVAGAAGHDGSAPSADDHAVPVGGRFAARDDARSVVHAPNAGDVPTAELSAMGVYDLVHTYREIGHACSTLDPLSDAPRVPHPLLALDNFGMTDDDMDAPVGTGGFAGPVDGTLRDLIDKLQRTYCGTVGVEFTHVADRGQREWLQARMEPGYNHADLTADEKRYTLFQLVAAEEFEQYLHRAFVGKKRFSAEGAEAMVPLLNTVAEDFARLGGEQVIFTMAHRGRLNVLAHVLNKPYETMMAEFEGTNSTPEGVEGDGDVKYHLGYANHRELKADDGTELSVKVSLLPNPSHLELVNPIQQGIVRCKQEWLPDPERRKVVPVTIHGDAAFCGQGIVIETLNLSELPGYRTGGTIHVIVNNQIGFTTPPKQGRFTPYATDMAKAIQAPIFHVNGDDPEAVVDVAKLAIAFRQEFRVDVIIDLYCYRRFGHNEQDEASFTQPVMARKILAHPTVRTIYADKLLAEGVVTPGDLDGMRASVLDRLKVAREAAKETRPREKVPSFSGVWRGMGRAGSDWSADTAVDRATLEKVAATQAALPDDFTVHPKLKKTLDARVEAVRTGRGIDWGTGEMLALGSLLLEGHGVRFTGQDVERGTFSHRHAVLHDHDDGSAYVPLQHIAEGQAPFTILNTMLSEEATVGFEWGFASADPRNLVVWEAQFGDFVNGAQALIDQVLSSAESKWRYMNGLVLNLPHGYEGAGPEHSNAYLDRFLSLCAEGNMQVAVPSTPAQYFHLLRRQVHRDFRKPLVLMMPKSLLRRPDAASDLSAFTDASLRLVIDDEGFAGDVEKVRRVVLCTGKVYYALDAARQKAGQADVAIVRVEQLYPWPEAEVEAAVNRYGGGGAEVVWAQEEPKNRGAWGYAQPRLRELFPGRAPTYVGRDAAASPSTGSPAAHEREERELVADALSVPPKAVPASAVAASQAGVGS